MNGPSAETSRASLEVARVALLRMMGAPPLPGASRNPPMTMAARSSDAWEKIELLLRHVAQRPDLAGQALLTEARRIDALDMPGMHAMVAMREWVERTLAPGSAAQLLTLPPTDAERDVAGSALAALERAAAVATADAAPISNLSGPTPIAVDDRTDSTIVPTMPATEWSPRPRAVPTPTADAGSAKVAGEGRLNSMDAVSLNRPAAVVDRTDGVDKRTVSSGLILTGVLVIILMVGGGAYLYSRGNTGGSASSTDQGAAAYARGAKEAARLAFVKAVQENPNDARALTYLGRISREQGSMATARVYLEKAIRIEPNNALASRELGSALLADAQYELARRFYVRALTINPSDRTAQGFLGCSLFKLNRNEEAQRWMDRAGSGAWSGCAPTSAIAPTKD